MPQCRDNSEPPPLTIPAIFPGMPPFPAFPGAGPADPQPLGNVPEVDSSVEIGTGSWANSPSASAVPILA